MKYFYLPFANSINSLLSKTSLPKLFYHTHNISEREQEIIELVMEGKSNIQIKDSLFISYHTVKNHLSNIYKKLNIKTRHELIHLALQEKEKLNT